MDLNDDGLVERADLIQMAKQAIDLSDEDVDSSFSRFDLKQQGNISRQDWESVFAQMYDQHILKGLQEAFAASFDWAKWEFGIEFSYVIYSH